MGIPKIGDKRAFDSPLTPHVALAYRGVALTPLCHAGRTAILCLQQPVLERARNAHGGETIKYGGFSSACSVQKTIVLRSPGFGAPQAALVLEDMIALGLKRCILIGIAGGLQPDCKPGDVILANAAIRDEGTSYHYLGLEEEACSDASLRESLEQEFIKRKVSFRTGTTWTTDAVYRETTIEIETFRKHGVLSVEMEAAALFAVATYRKISLAAVLVISDLLSPGKWSPKFRDPKVKKALEDATDCALAVLAKNTDDTSLAP